MDHLPITTLTTLSLPAELCLHIISFLPIFHILRLRLISRAWNLFIANNETSVYRAAAVLHGFAARHQGLEECKQESAVRAFPFLEHVTSWKELCRSHYFLEMRCTGQLRAHRGEISSVGGQVDQFKIDEEQRTVISTTTGGGLYVVDMENDEILWSIRVMNVRANTLFEFGGGFLILNRAEYRLEVWRRKRDSQSGPLPSAPDDAQKAVARKAFQAPESVRQDDRGAFVPFRIISPQHGTSAYRFIYPTLMVVANKFSGNEAWFYDIRTGELSQKIPFHSFRATCVDFNARHVFMTSAPDFQGRALVTTPHDDDGLVIFSRDPSCEPPYLRFQPAKQRFTNAFDIYHLDPEPLHSGDGILEYSIRSNEQGRPKRRWLGEPHAVRVSPCGSYVVLTAASDPGGDWTKLFSTVYIIHGFEDVLEGSHDPPPCSITLIVIKATEIRELEFEENRIAFHTGDQWDNNKGNLGVLIIPFAPPESMPITVPSKHRSEHPWLRIFQVYPNPRLGDSADTQVLCSCIQVNKTAVWYTLCELEHDFEGIFQAKTLRYVDFGTRSPAEMVRFYKEMFDRTYETSSSDASDSGDIFASGTCVC